MANEPDNLVLELLRAIRATQAEHSEKFNRVELRLATIEQIVGNLYSLSGSDRELITTVSKRVDKVEQRLGNAYQEKS